MSSAALPRIVDPRAAPVVATDTHLAPIADEALGPGRVRSRVTELASAGFVPEFAGDAGELFPERELASAAVLVPLVWRDGGLHLLLTERTSHLRDHAGQISFPGGRAEAGDTGAIDTALRESEEEIGLARTHVDVIGTLPVYTTVTRYVVTPVVALVTPPFELELDDFEVAEAFEVPLPFLMNPAHHRHHAVAIGGVTRRFLSMPWHDPRRGREYFIWGATAAMIRNLYRVLADPR